MLTIRRTFIDRVIIIAALCCRALQHLSYDSASQHHTDVLLLQLLLSASHSPAASAGISQLIQHSLHVSNAAFSNELRAW
ncbi:MAG: hypothetical protein RIT02_41 [Planctomycetota bacterium]|jgi:hypothetical protein